MQRVETRSDHPFLTGNFAPVDTEICQAPCEIQGTLPVDLIGGQYVRNGSNFRKHRDWNQDLHWFDGDGMLSSVYFHRVDDSTVRSEYSNRYVVTDVFLAESKLSRPLLPSLATLMNPNTSSLRILKVIFRTVWIVLLSFLSRSLRSVKRISVANTNILYHHGRALATCESGPPMRVLLPYLQTVGWFDGLHAEGEPEKDRKSIPNPGFTGGGLLGAFREWTTAHPHIDPVTGEMVLFHSTFVPPTVRVSVLPGPNSQPEARMLGTKVPGVRSPRMMHDFGVSHKHTVIIDIPLSLNPLNILFKKPVVAFDPRGRTRFGVFPRHNPKKVQWFATEPCCIFHTVNTWDEAKGDDLQAKVNMLVCRMTGPSIVYATGSAPLPSKLNPSEEECRLYYYQFAIDSAHPSILQQWALSAIPFEFPHIPNHLEMSTSQFVYGCSVAQGSYAEQLRHSMRIASLVKVNVAELIDRGLSNPPNPISGCVDSRSMEDILAAGDLDDPIQVFLMPEGHCAQEPVFIPREGCSSEDDGWLLTFVFDERQLNSDGTAPAHAKSELWIIDAKTMRTVEARILLPQRVPYGLHGSWFSEDEIARQRPVKQFKA